MYKDAPEKHTTVSAVNLKNKRSCPYLKTRECSTAEQHGSLNRESGKAMQNPYQSSSKSLWVLLVPTTANSVNGPVVESLIPNANLYVVGRQHAAAAAGAGAGAGGRRRRITSTKLSSRKNNNHLNEENIRRCFLVAQKTNDFVAPVLIWAERRQWILTAVHFCFTFFDIWCVCHLASFRWIDPGFRPALKRIVPRTQLRARGEKDCYCMYTLSKRLHVERPGIRAKHLAQPIRTRSTAGRSFEVHLEKGSTRRVVLTGTGDLPAIPEVVWEWLNTIFAPLTLQFGGLPIPGCNGVTYKHYGMWPKMCRCAPNYSHQFHSPLPKWNMNCHIFWGHPCWKTISSAAHHFEHGILSRQRALPHLLDRCLSTPGRPARGTTDLGRCCSCFGVKLCEIKHI